MKKFAAIVLAVTAILFAVSCKKGSGSAPIPKGCFISMRGNAAGYDTVYYDDYFHLIKFDRKRADGTTLFSFHYLYNRNDLIESLTTLDSLGNVNVRTEYVYNTSQQVDTETNFTFVGNVAYPYSFNVYQYDANGNVTTAAHWGLSGATFTLKSITYYTEYDASGNNTRGYDNDSLGNNVDSFYYTFDNYPYPLKFTFDQRRFHNNVLTFHEAYPVLPDYNISYIYQYDAKGNPTRRDFTGTPGPGFETFTYICNN